MKQVPDRKKLRQEYLRKKRSKYMDAAISIAIMLPVAIPLLFALFFGRDQLAPEARWIGSFIVTLLLALAVYVAFLRIRRAQEDVHHIPYVPPVTPDTLPADEILVRGSEEPPVAQSAVLLRAAQQGQETAKEELLHVSQE